MKTLATLAVVAALVLPAALPHPAEANVIKRACLKADRKAATRRLCGCIQDVADSTLSRSEQRKGAKFFKDPQKAQDVRQSGSSTNSAFWKKWKNFGVAARNHCG